MTTRRRIKKGRRLTKKAGSPGQLIKKLKSVLDKTYQRIRLDPNYEDLVRQLLNLNKHKDRDYIAYKTNLCIVNLTIDPKQNKYKYNIPNKGALPQDSRLITLESVFKGILKWAKHSGNDVAIETAIFIWISDRYIWEIEDIDKRLPICLFACPQDLNYVIIPDSTFFSLSLDQRYASRGVNWETQKALFTDPGPILKKKVFFRGADTTYLSHGLRRYLYNKFKNENDKEFKRDIIYEFLTGANYDPIDSFKSYKFMLNLPGQYPWSTRLKYLYLGRHYIINVRVYTYMDEQLHEDNYHSFVDLIVPPDEYCINIDMKYYYYPGIGKVDASHPVYDAKNKAECEHVYQEIKRIYYEYRNRQPLADKKVNDSYNMINDLTTPDMYAYFLAIAEHNQALGINQYG